MVKTVNICTNGECGGECYACRVKRLSQTWEIVAAIARQYRTKDVHMACPECGAPAFGPAEHNPDCRFYKWLQEHPDIR